MGTTATNNNARVLNETTDRMKNYRVPSNEVVLDNITIPGLGYADVIAKNTITATNFTTAPGSIVNLRAGQEIVIGPDSHIEGDFSATIEPVIDCCTNSIIPIVQSGSGIAFPVCTGGGSQLCLGFNCATSFSITIYNSIGQLIYQSSGGITDNVGCIWNGLNNNGSPVAQGTYIANVTVSNSSQNMALTYTITVISANCKMAGNTEPDIKEEVSLVADQSTSVNDLSKENDLTLLVYPNPVNNQAVIEYSLPRSGKISLTIINAFGQEVLKIVDNQQYQSGRYRINLEATYLSAGIYYYSLRTEERTETKKFILIK